MKNIHSIFYVLLMFALASCSTQNFTPISQVTDDSYWTEKDDEKVPGKNIKESEPWNKSNNNRSEPMPSRYDNEPSSSSYSSIEDARGRNARETWDRQRYSENSTPSAENTQSNYIPDEEQEERDYQRRTRRFGSNRTYFYDDPYYQVLSPAWGWTNFYNPIIRPGFYNWAPGWNVGLSWNSFSGFGMGMGFNQGFGFNPFFNDPWMYGGGWGMGFYDPWRMPFYNPYSPWGLNPWYHPYGFGYGGFYNPWGPWGFRNRHFNRGFGGNDVVTNRPFMQPRATLGSSIPGARGTARPSNQTFDGRSVRDARPNPSSVTNENTTNPNFRANEPVRSYSPERPATNRPGGELRPDESGRPVYVSPNNNTPIRSAEPNSGGSNRPGGELREGPNGTQIYVPPSRNRYEDNSGGRPSINNDRPSRGFDGGGGVNPSRNPGYERPSYDRPSNDSPRNRGGGGSYSAPPSRPAPSRPSYSPSPSSRPSAPSGPANRAPSGGGMRPR
ncbi:MAG: hypothetical protein MH472_07665 [Bacteroidia bacterium]|nr:hypothetical protein [Bacteroidia bacterium]